MASSTVEVRQGGVFSGAELRRVGVAATMIVVGGTLIIVAMTILLGHYSTLSHCGPKAVLDGAVVAMLLGRRCRWRCLALLGTVYGLVLLLQIGVFYLLAVMAMAGVAGAAAGWAASWLGRRAAVVAAAATYELLCGFGAPVQIYLGTGGRHEPVIWGLWFAEWPLRIGGACIGVWLAWRWMARRRAAEMPSGASRVMVVSGTLGRRTKNWKQAGLAVAMCILACTVPMGVNSAVILATLAVLFAIYGLWAGLRWRLVQAAGGLTWGWITFGLMSYLWQHDLHRVLDLGRTLALRFAPLAVASLVLASTVRPIDLIRLLRKLRVSGAILIPLATVARALPRARQMIHASMAELKQRSRRDGRLALIYRPAATFRTLIGVPWAMWSEQLVEKTE